MPPPRSLPKSSRWASVTLALAAAFITLHHGTAVHAVDLTPPRTTILPMYDIPPPSPRLLSWANVDAVATLNNDIGTIVQSYQTIDQPSNFNTSIIAPWHTRTIEYATFTRIATIQPGRLEIMHHPDLLGANHPVLVKRAPLAPAMSLSGYSIESSSSGIARETEVYRLLDGLGVAPLFLGHVAEGGVITGFVVEYVVQQTEEKGEEDGERRVAGDRGRERERGTEACLSALRVMHGRGIAHGDAHGGNCLVRCDGEAFLVDFELAGVGASEEEFERDLWVMRYSRSVEVVM